MPRSVGKGDPPELGSDSRANPSPNTPASQSGSSGLARALALYLASAEYTMMTERLPLSVEG